MSSAQHKQITYNAAPCPPTCRQLTSCWTQVDVRSGAVGQDRACIDDWGDTVVGLLPWLISWTTRAPLRLDMESMETHLAAAGGGMEVVDKAEAGRVVAVGGGGLERSRVHTRSPWSWPPPEPEEDGECENREETRDREASVCRSSRKERRRREVDQTQRRWTPAHCCSIGGGSSEISPPTS
jgi:hypothetical protein